jgi:VWFA-related protein
MWRASGIVLAIVLALGAALVAQDDVIHVSTELVTVTVLATDRNGRPIEDLKRDEFMVFDDGRRRPIQAFHRELDMPLTFGLVVDTSGTQANYVEKHKADLQQFFKAVLQPRDRAFLVTIPNTARLDVDLTDSVESLQQATARLTKWGAKKMNKETFGGNCPPILFVSGRTCGTLIWNGVWAAAKLRLHNETGRKAIVLMTDGLDTGSEHSLAATIEAAQGADAPVYTIASLPHFPFTSRVRAENSGLAMRLQRLSEETGGGYFLVTTDPSGIFQQIEEELRHLYVLSFTLPEADRDGKFHRLDVRTSRADVKVRARAGYVAN